MFPEGYKNPNSASPVLHGDGKSQADCDYEPKPSQTISRKDIINKKGPITLYIGMKLIFFMSIIMAWACEPRASPYSFCSFLQLSNSSD
jgi:hypothetical protein